MEELYSNNSIIERPICRFCFDDKDQEDLFIPCHCTGTARYVHKKCLRKWRSQDIYSLNYTRCQECLFSYELINNISFRLSCWIKCCKYLSYSPITTIILFTEFISIYLLLFHKFKIHKNVGGLINIINLISFNNNFII